MTANLAELQARRAQILDEIATIDCLRRGHLSEQFFNSTRDGKTSRRGSNSSNSERPLTSTCFSRLITSFSSIGILRVALPSWDDSWFFSLPEDAFFPTPAVHNFRKFLLVAKPPSTCG